MRAYCRHCVKQIELKAGGATFEVAVSGLVLARTVCPDCGEPTGTRIVAEAQAPQDIRLASQAARKAARHYKQDCKQRRDAAILLLLRALKPTSSGGSRRRRSNLRTPEPLEALSEAFGLSIRRIWEINLAGDVQEASRLVNSRRRSSRRIRLPDLNPDQPIVFEI